MERLKFYAAMLPGIVLNGVILTESMPLDEAEKLASAHPDKKFVYVNYYFKGFEDTRENIYGVFNDDFGGGYQIADYFAEKGLRKFAICSLQLSDMNYQYRVDGFNAALEGHGIRVPESCVSCPKRNEITTLPKHGYDTAKRILASNRNLPELILCVNDEMAKGAASFVREQNLEKRVRVAGYDGILLQKDDGVNGTVKINFESIGAKSFEIIMNKAGKYPKTIKIAPNLITL